MKMEKQSELLIAGEQAFNNEQRLENWKRKKIQLAIENRRCETEKKPIKNVAHHPLHLFRFKHH